MKRIDKFAMFFSESKMITSYSAKAPSCARILLVDDNHLGLRVRTAVLEELGHHVTAVSCGKEALHRFLSERFDLVVTDYRMPELNGIELTARIREQHPSVPVIMISGLAEALGLNESNTGADIVVQKNCHEVATLTRSVLRLLSRKGPKKQSPLEPTAALAG
jgi:CheY-like chemotaxis protein